MTADGHVAGGDVVERQSPAAGHAAASKGAAVLPRTVGMRGSEGHGVRSTRAAARLPRH